MVMMIYLIKIIFFLILINWNINAKETQNNKILFKINDKVFTIIDVEERINYIKIINNLEKIDLNNSNKKEILDDYISALIFYEHYIINQNNYKNLQKEIDYLYENNISKSELIKDLNYQEIENVKSNIKVDIIRKKLIDELINLRKNNLVKEVNRLDLIYNYNISYLLIKEGDIDLLTLENIKNREDLNNLKNKLLKDNISFLQKTEDINDNTVISKFFKKIIYNNEKIFFEISNGFITLVSVEKNLESYEGIFVKLISFSTENKLNVKNMNCNNLNNTIDINKTTYKEYEYSQLNERVKVNLKSINDYMIYEDANTFNYIFLCNLRYDEKLLNNINFNKKINSLAKKVEIYFLNKYKYEYNFKKVE